MSHKENWLEKTFNFDFPISRYAEFLEVLRQTPTHLEKLVESLPKDVITRRDGEAWSIQENAGHFLTAESLFTGRLEDYQNNTEVLRPARFEDNPTDKADFNSKDIQWILREFRAQREDYINQLDMFDPQEFGKASLHPRLQKPMRICDMLLFHAKHDQHHLSRIKELKEQWQV